MALKVKAVEKLVKFNKEDAGEYAEGTQVTVTATAADGYEFLRWSDDDANATRTVTLNADAELTAVFAQS